MKRRTNCFSRSLPLLAAALVVAVGLAGCGGGGFTSTRTTSNPVTGTVSTTMSDPPTCKGPLAPSDLQLEKVILTITKVRAHLSSGAGESDAGWVDLVDLTSNPKQIDFLSGGDTQCILAVLGSTTALPAGNYQQIRIHLLSNNPAGGAAVPSPNLCDEAGPGPGPYNCVKPVGASLQPINLSSQDRTGLKIPPGRISGGRIQLEEGQAADIDINFNACNSIVLQGNGEFRLLPTLHAGEVSLATDTLSGRIVALQLDSTTAPIPTPATIVVYAEQPDTEGIDRVLAARALASDGDGSFNFCPLPAEGNYDVVAAAIDTNGVTYNATIIFNVPPGTNLGDIALVPESADGSTEPGILEGVVSTQDTGGVATAADISMSPLQAATPSGGSERKVTIPTFGESTLTFTTADSTAELTCPADTKCAAYTLNVPASNPRVGTFSGGSVTYVEPAAGDVAYSVNALAFVPGSEGAADCSPSSLTTDKLEDGATALTVTAGATSTAETLAFTGCEAGH